jgi:hypothetical protein
MINENDGAAASMQSRRAVVRAAAWSVPAVTIAAAAPAYAVSPPAGCTPSDPFTLPEYTSSNWASSLTSTNGAGTAGIQQLNGSNTFCNAEPNGGHSVMTATVTTNDPVFFEVGRTYYFSIPYSYNTGNPLPMRASLLVGSTVLTPSPFADSDITTPTSGTATVVFTPSANTTDTVQIRRTVDNSANANKVLGDDMTIGIITVASCLDK